MSLALSDHGFRIIPYAREYTKEEIEALEDRIQVARVFLSVYFPFFGYLVSRLKIKIAQEHDRVATACVTPDGIIYINYEFGLKLTDGELRFLLVHEMLHPALLYFTRVLRRRNDVFNVAHDLVINKLISDYSTSDFVKAKASNQLVSVDFIKGGQKDEKFDGKSAEEIYDELLPVILKKEEGQKDGKNQGNSPNSAKGGKGKGKGKSSAKGSKSDGNSQGEDEENEEQDSSKGSLSSIQDDKNKKKGTGAKGPGERGDGTEEEQESDCRPDLAEDPVARRAAQGDSNAARELEQRWALDIEAARQHHKNTTRGDLPGGWNMIIKDLFTPKMTWIDYVSNFIGENMRFPDSSYRRVGRRSEEIGELLPGTIYTGIPDVTVLWDTSGSMYGLEKTILSEVAGICEDLNLSIRIIMCDAAVQAIYESVTDMDISILGEKGIKGGGGSDFGPALRLMEMENNDSLLLVFTDGYIGTSEMPPPLLKGALWVVIPESGPKPATWGDVIFVDNKGFVVDKEGAVKM